MSLLHDKISPLIDSQFPGFYREEGPMFVNFVKEYYKWLESSGNALYHARHLLDYGDIDTTLDEFIPHYQQKYLAGSPVINIANQRDLIKHTRDIYQTKGTIDSLRLIFQMLFGATVDVYYPGDDILRASDGDWIIPRYLELSISPQTAGFVGRDVVGNMSGARAFVERVDRRTYRGKTVDLLFITNIRPNATTGSSFVYGEYVTVDGIISGAPMVVGSLTRIEVTGSGAGFGAGEIVDVVSSRRGRNGRARVADFGNRTGEVNYTLLSGGYGYTNVSSLAIVSANVLSITALTEVTPSSIAFPEFSTVVQPLINVAIGSANTTFNAGDMVYGSNSSTTIATGFVLAANNVAGWLLISPHTTAKLTIDNVTSPTITGSFGVGEAVYQSNSTGNAAVGFIAYANATHVVIDQRFGPFVANTQLVSSGSTCTANVVSVTTRAYDSTNFADANISIIIKGEGANGALKTGATNLTVTANVVGANSTAIGVYEISPHIKRINLQSNTIVNANTVTNSYEVGEFVYQSNSAVGNTAVGYVTAANSTTVTVDQRIGTFVAGAYIRGATSNCYANATSATTTSVNVFKGGSKSWLYSTATNASAEVTVTSSGLPGYFRIGGLTNTESISVCTDNIGPYMGVTLNANTGYGLPANTSVGFYDVIGAGLSRTNMTIGSVLSLTEKYPGFNNTAKPFVVEIEKKIAAYAKPSIVNCITNNVTGSFRVGEGISQNIPVNRVTLNITNVSNTFNYAAEEVVKQIRADSHITFGQVYSVNVANGSGTISMYVANTANTFDSVSSIIGLKSTATADVSGVTTGTVNIVAHGVLTSFTPSSASIARTSFVDFVAGRTIVGDETGASADTVEVNWSADVEFLGNNANVDPIAGIANGTIVSLEVVDSGVFYEDGEEVVLSVPGNQTPGAGIARVETTGIMEGFWRGDRGTLDSSKRVQDNEYYQEYAYEIRSGVDRSVYESAVNNITHVAGTRMYSKYVNDTFAQNLVDTAPSTYGVLTNIAVPNSSSWGTISTLVSGDTIVQKDGSTVVASGQFVDATQRAINSIVTLANTSGTFTTNNSIYIGNTSIGVIQSVGREIY